MKHYILFSAFTLLNMVLNQSFGAENELKLYENRQPEKVKLPFKYTDTSSIKNANITWVPERFYHLLSDDSQELALIGPLQPCILVALRNNENGKSIVFHKHYSNKLDHLVHIAKTWLDVKIPSNVQGHIFTNISLDFNTPSPSGESYQDRHEGRSQRDEVKMVKDKLIESFGISERKQIQANLYTSPSGDSTLGEYEFAELFVLANSKLELTSFCPMHESFFNNGPVPAVSATINLYVKRDAFQKKFFENLRNKWKQHFSMKDEKDLDSYGKIDFVNINEKDKA